MLDTGWKMEDAGYRLPITGYWLLDAGWIAVEIPPLRGYRIAASIFISLVKDAEKKLIKRKYNG